MSCLVLVAMYKMCFSAIFFSRWIYVGFVLAVMYYMCFFSILHVLYSNQINIVMIIYTGWPMRATHSVLIGVILHVKL